MTDLHDFYGPNAGYVLELYERYQHDPASVDAATRAVFARWPPSLDGVNGASAVATIAPGPGIDKIAGAANLAQAIRDYGHLEAKLNPLGSPRLGDPMLSPDAHGISDDDLRQMPASIIGGPTAAGAANALEAIHALRVIYSTSIGFDNEHIRIPEERLWLREAAESRRYRPELTPEFSLALLERLTQIEAFENFLQRTFPTKYRFSIEGLDTMVPMLDELIHLGSDTGITSLMLAMAHRGRLNVLAHIMDMPYEQILADFKDPLKVQEIKDAIGWTMGDVKYHRGTLRSIQIGTEHNMKITMPPNPSHLEVINPVAGGMARAAGSLADQPGEPSFDPRLTFQVVIHGDAAFPGEGVVAETLNLSQLPGYWIGGTIHIIANNQLGFTTLPRDGRSTLYASDLAKGFKIPIIHVNADDPEACIEVMRIVFAYQETFEKDILINLIGYRRYGHNELDEPGFTQPLEYRAIRAHPPVRQLWADKLIERGITTAEDARTLTDKYVKLLQSVNDSLDERVEEFVEPPPPPPPPGEAKRVKTSVAAKRLRAINDSLGVLPEGFNFFSSRLESTIRARRAALDAEKPSIDWAAAEELAFATILEDGVAIRLTGQDSERGTFSQRHAVLHDAKTGETFVPLQALAQAKASFEIRNSPLSEVAALGFEYGYNVQEPGRLVLWEAQYGDFANVAQVIVDEFIASAREKWGQTPSLVLLLPHGWEGAGPDHSSARLERFLDLCAKTNMRVTNPTTAAQYFHLLRRQAILLKTDPLPLIVMTPKSLLRNPAGASSLKQLTEGRWQPLIDDEAADASKVTRLVLCSGKFYFDLIASDLRDRHPEVAIARLEQLYPFPADELKTLVRRYGTLKEIVWAQEEPKNMGGWQNLNWRLQAVAGKLPVNCIGRRRSPSPAEGSQTAHKVDQQTLVEHTYTFQFTAKSLGTLEKPHA